MARDIDEELMAVRTRIIEELQTIDGEAAALRYRADGLRKTLISLDSVLGIEDAAPVGYQAVRKAAAEAIVAILTADDTEPKEAALTVGQVVTELRRRGWLPDSPNPDGAVRASIRRLVQRYPEWEFRDGRLHHVGDTIVVPGSHEDRED